ncbi:MAG TPA: sigma-54 dependent transcriptional regulator [Candidatus Polarisedimenticolaceae bacterium]|nr:sigma-54 dependent transcriptional regulator [Candidatus Polarisedimenticolaceae bacterium]
MTAALRLLLVDDDESFRRVQEYQLAQAGYEVDSVADGQDALDRFRDRLHELVVSDVRMPGLDGLGLLARIHAISADTPVVIITAQATVETAVEAMKRGAFDFLTKPFPGEKLRLTLGRAREFARLRRENRQLRRQVEERLAFRNLIGSSPAMQRLFESMELAAPTPSTVLILGETGTGKELVARAIHYNSPRKAGPFVTVNCGAIPDSLIEAELFGYRRGAFTGADSDRKGRFETADGGTLLLDEVGEIPPALQPKILRVLQAGEVDRLGADRPIRVDVRILAATHRDLEAMVQRGEFRQDLYYRLAVVPLTVPALRDRRDDIPLLAEHFLAKMRVQAERPGLRLPPRAFALFDRYTWPGNVRELENTIERMVVLSRQDELSEETLPEKIRGGAAGALATGFRLPPGGVRLEELERDLLRQALERHDGNRTKAARELGLTRNTLLYRMQKYGLR